MRFPDFSTWFTGKALSREHALRILKHLIEGNDDKSLRLLLEYVGDDPLLTQARERVSNIKRDNPAPPNSKEFCSAAGMRQIRDLRRALKNNEPVEPVLAVSTNCGDVEYCESLEAAQREMEPYDADSWAAYFTDGRIISVTVDRAPRTFFSDAGDDRINLIPTGKSNVEGLRQILFKHLRYLKQLPRHQRIFDQYPEIDNDDTPLSILVELLRVIHNDA